MNNKRYTYTSFYQNVIETILRMKKVIYIYLIIYFYCIDNLQSKISVLKTNFKNKRIEF